MTQPWFHEEKVAYKGSVVLSNWMASRHEQKAALQTADFYKELMGQQSNLKSGQIVNHKTAFYVSTVFRCAALLSEGLAMVPWKLHQMVGERITEAKDDDLYWLLSNIPNEFQSSFEMREQIGLHLALCQEAFVFKNIVRGRVVELLPYAPNVVTKVKRPDMTTDFKISLGNGRSIDVPAKNMWWIKGKTWDGHEPLEIIKVAREAIGLSMAAEEHSARVFSNGARVGGILSTDLSLEKKQVDDLRESWNLTQGGAQNAFKTAVLYGGLKFSPVGFNNVDSQLNETRRNQVEEICRFMGVLPIMVGFSDKTVAYASAEAMFTAHVQYTLMPLYRRVEQSADKDLVTLARLKQGFYNKFNASALLRGSIKDRGDFYTKLYNIGALNPNEIRALEERNPYEGGEKYRVPLNMADPTNEPGNDDKPDDEDKPNKDKED